MQANYTQAQNDSIAISIALDDSVSDAVALFNDLAAAINSVLAQHNVSDDVACYAQHIVDDNGSAVY